MKDLWIVIICLTWVFGGCTGNNASELVDSETDSNIETGAFGQLEWHSVFGEESQATGIAQDSAGNLYAVGFSYEEWYGPAGQAPLRPHTNQHDLFVLKTDAKGAYIWHTFIGVENYHFEGAIH